MGGQIGLSSLLPSASNNPPECLLETAQISDFVHKRPLTRVCVYSVHATLGSSHTSACLRTSVLLRLEISLWVTVRCIAWSLNISWVHWRENPLGKYRGTIVPSTVKNVSVCQVELQLCNALTRPVEAVLTSSPFLRAFGPVSYPRYIRPWISSWVHRWTFSSPLINIP